MRPGNARNRHCSTKRAVARHSRGFPTKSLGNGSISTTAPASAANLGTARFVEQCSFQANHGLTWMERLDREAAAASPGVRVLDLDDLACPRLPVCDAMVAGRVVWWDGKHLAHDYVVARSEDLYRRLVGEGILPP